MKFTASNLRPVGNGLSLDLNFDKDCGCGTPSTGNGGTGGGSNIVFWSQIRDRPECILDCGILFKNIKEQGLAYLQNSSEITFTTDVNGIKTAFLAARGTAGTFGTASKTVRLTVNDKGVITALEEVDIEIPANKVTYTHISDGSITNVKEALDKIIAATDKHFAFTQASPATSWIIDHNLNKRPSVSVITAAGDTAVGNIAYTSVNRVTLTFSVAIAGSAFMN